MHASWKNTVYGSAFISERAVRIETNSIERADILRARLEGICGTLIRHRLREHQDPLSQRATSVPRPAHPPLPEVQALLQQHVEAMMRDWLDAGIPALQGKTPRQAVRSKRGREQVELLLKDMERAQSRSPDAPAADFRALRDELGLTP